MDGFQNSQHEHWQASNNSDRPLSARVPPALASTVLQRLGLEDAPAPSPALEDLYSADWQQRIAALHSSGATQMPLPLLLAALDDEDGSVRAAALHALGEHVPPNRLLAALQDTDWHVRETAIFALKQQQRAITPELLASALQDSDSSVRAAAQLVQQWVQTQPAETTTTVTHDDHSAMPVPTNAKQQQIMHMPPVKLVEEEPPFIKNTANHSGRKKRQETMMQEQEHGRIRDQEEGRERVPSYGYYEDYHGPSAYWEKVTNAPAQQYPLPERRSGGVPVSILVISALMLIVAIGGVASWALVYRSASSSKVIQAVNKSAVPTVVQVPGIDNTTIYTYHGHTQPVDAVAWSPDGTRIASASLDGTVQVWDATTGNNVVIHKGLPSYSTLAWSPNGQEIASASLSSQTVELWNAATGQTISTYQLQPAAAANVSHIGALSRLSGCGDGVNKLAWSPDGKSLAVAGDYQQHGLVEIFDVQSGSIRLTNTDFFACANALSWSPNGKYIASDNFDGTKLNVWNATTGQVITNLAGTNGLVRGAAWSPNGQSVAFSFEGAAGVSIWNPFTNENYTFDVSEDVFQTAWSPDGQRIAIITPNNTVRLYDTQSGAILSVYTGTSEGLTVAWSPKGNLIASSGVEGSVQVWKA